jgi:DNA-binding transcriptional MerR regulator
MTLHAEPNRKIFYKIGEVSEMTQLPSYVLRFWESQFGFLRPQKSRGQQRLYLQRDIETVLEIKRMLYDEGYTIAGLKRYWARRGRRAGKRINPREVTERLRGNLQAILRILDSYKPKS